MAVTTSSTHRLSTIRALCHWSTSPGLYPLSTTTAARPTLGAMLQAAVRVPVCVPAAGAGAAPKCATSASIAARAQPIAEMTCPRQRLRGKTSDTSVCESTRRQVVHTSAETQNNPGLGTGSRLVVGGAAVIDLPADLRVRAKIGDADIDIVHDASRASRASSGH